MYSIEHKKYLRKNKLYNLKIKLVQILIIVLFIFVWQYLADKEIINTFIFSSPKKVINCLISLHQNKNLYSHIGITVYETLISFVLGTIIGIFIATIMWLSKFFAKVIDPYLTILNSLPKVAIRSYYYYLGWRWILNLLLLMALFDFRYCYHYYMFINGFNDTDHNRINLLKVL